MPLHRLVLGTLSTYLHKLHIFNIGFSCPHQSFGHTLNSQGTRGETGKTDNALGTQRTTPKVNPSFEKEGRQPGNLAERDFGSPARPVGNAAGVRAPTRLGRGEGRGQGAPRARCSPRAGEPGDPRVGSALLCLATQSQGWTAQQAEPPLMTGSAGSPRRGQP